MMSKWLFRRSNSESVKARTEQVSTRPKRPRPRSTLEKDFEDVEIAELEKELPQAYEVSALYMYYHLIHLCHIWLVHYCRTVQAAHLQSKGC